MMKPKPHWFLLFSFGLIPVSFVVARFYDFSVYVILLVALLSGIIGLVYDNVVLTSKKLKQAQGIKRFSLVLWSVIHCSFFTGFFCVFFLFFLIISSVWQIKWYGKYRLNHQALLAESRQMIKEKEKYQQLAIKEDGPFQTDPRFLIISNTRDPLLPNLIREIEASNIYIQDNEITIKKGNIAFQIYTNDNGTPRNINECEKLIDGLYMCTYIRD